MKIAATTLAIALTLSLNAFAGPAGISGSYIESRSMDVYTAACFANSEIGLTGEEATLAWSIEEGSFAGADLAGLSAVLVVRAKDSLTHIKPSALPAKSVLLIDERASESQAAALRAFVEEMSAGLANDIVRTEHVAIAFKQADSCGGDECAALQAGDLVSIEARCLHDSDSTCMNDSVFFEPLTAVYDAMPHFTKLDVFQGEGLGVRWAESGRRSVYIARFAR